MSEKIKKYECKECPRKCTLTIEDTAFPWSCPFSESNGTDTEWEEVAMDLE